jgi:arylsulfatase A-like enzyme
VNRRDSWKSGDRGRAVDFRNSRDAQARGLTTTLALGGIALSMLGCGGGQPEAAGDLNVLLVTIDTLREDHCSVSGYARPTTPGLERLAEQGVRMELAYAPTSTTGPTHASIFTSLYPIAHGVRKNGMRLDEEIGTLAEALKEAGYRTGAVVSSFVLDAKFGYARGFDSYEDDFDPATATIFRSEFDGQVAEGAFDRRADETTRQAVRMIEDLARGDAPFFAFVHYFDPHYPYTPPDGYASMFPSGSADELSVAISAYDGEIAFADREVDVLLRFLERLGLDDDTLVVVTADHGEGLMEHGHMKHGVQIYEEAVRVPLLFRLPGRLAGGRSLEEPVELLDLMPTILDLAGVPAGEELQGLSLAGPLLGTGRLEPDRAVYLHRRHYDAQRIGEIEVAGEKFGVRVGPWKYIEGEAEGSRELFNLSDDPEERVDLRESFPEVAQDLASRIAAWRMAHTRQGGDQPQLSPEDVERLRALGYLN